MSPDLRQTSIFDAKPIVQRDNACTRLRALLSDGRWHTATELHRVAGRRFGARIMEVRRGDDRRPPLDVEGERIGSGDCEWRYRAVRYVRCADCGQPVAGVYAASPGLRVVCAQCSANGRAP